MYKKDLIKNNREKVEIVFPIISQWEFSVTMETNLPQNLMQLFPLSSDAKIKI